MARAILVVLATSLLAVHTEADGAEEGSQLGLVQASAESQIDFLKAISRLKQALLERQFVEAELAKHTTARENQTIGAPTADSAEQQQQQQQQGGVAANVVDKKRPATRLVAARPTPTGGIALQQVSSVVELADDLRPRPRKMLDSADDEAASAVLPEPGTGKVQGGAAKMKRNNKRRNHGSSVDLIDSEDSEGSDGSGDAASDGRRKLVEATTAVKKHTGPKATDARGETKTGAGAGATGTKTAPATRPTTIDQKMAEAEALIEAAQPNLEKCKVQGQADPTHTLAMLKDCTAELKKMAQVTMDAHHGSMNANTKYVNKFKEVMDLMKKLESVHELQEAFDKDHENVRRYLVGEAKKLETPIKQLGENALPVA